MTPANNLIILTTGASGSSVLAGVMGTQGYWLGDDTKKLQFDTYENAELVDLNMKLMEMAGFHRRDANDIPPPDVDAVKALQQHPDLSRFEKFMDKCRRRGPWLWKDPRLAYTIHFWEMFAPVRKADFIFIDREPRQSYAGLLLSRKVPMAFHEQSRMNRNYKISAEKFLCRWRVPVYDCLFEELMLGPEAFLDGLNKRFGLVLTLADLTRVYKGKLYSRRYSGVDFYKARILYLLYRFVRKEHIRFPRTTPDGVAG